MESKDLAEVLKGLERLYIVGHKGFCYDVLGSAFGLAHIAEAQGIETKVCAEIRTDWGFPQNNVLFNKYQLDNKIISPSDIEEGAPVAYVDVYPENTNGYDNKGVPHMIINHHPEEDCTYDLSKAKFVDTRPAGSTIALIADHMERMGLELTEKDAWLSTLMMYGLRTDNRRYLKGVDLSIDHRVSEFLRTHADMDIISKLESRKYPIEILNILRQMDERQIGKYRIAVIKATKPGMVPQLADMLSGFDGAPMNIVLGKVPGEEREWFVSARNSASSYNVAELVVDLFGSGGGHWYAAGATLSTKEVYERFGVDESKNRSVLKQILATIAKRLKVLSNEKT